MEAYPATLNGRVLRFLTSWTRELHTLGYSSGVYSNSLSGVQALVSNYANPSDTMPDVIYDALWNGVADTSDPILPGTDWAGHQRIHQYAGGQNATYGGYTINIDKDYLDVQQGVTGGSPQASQAAAQSAGDVDAFFKGADGRLWHDWYAPGSGWHGPVSLGGSLATKPSAVASVPGNVAVFARGTEGPPAGGLLRARDELVRAAAAEGGHRGQQASRGRPGQWPDRRVLARVLGQAPVARRVPAGERLGQAAGPGRPPGFRPGPRRVGPRRADCGLERHQRPPVGDPPLGAVLGQAG